MSTQNILFDWLNKYNGSSYGVKLPTTSDIIRYEQMNGVDEIAFLVFVNNQSEATLNFNIKYSHLAGTFNNIIVLHDE